MIVRSIALHVRGAHPLNRARVTPPKRRGRRGDEMACFTGLFCDFVQPVPG
jgi:hypothetical protein